MSDGCSDWQAGSKGARGAAAPSTILKGHKLTIVSVIISPLLEEEIKIVFGKFFWASGIFC